MPRPWRGPLLLAVSALVFLGAHQASADSKRHNRLFMTEFARYVKGRLGDEPVIREKVRRFVLANAGALKDGGIGRHPEFLPKIYEEAGVDRLNCIQGRQFDFLKENLNNEEREFFYDASQRLDWYVAQIVVEEADKAGVHKASPPLPYRFQTDIPYYIGVSLADRLRTYLSLDLDEEDKKGISFDRLPCE